MVRERNVSDFGHMELLSAGDGMGKNNLMN